MKLDSFIRYSACPVCGSPAITDKFTVRDYTVTNKEFPVAECNECTLRFTQDIPDAEAIAAYYESENYISHTDTSRGLINNIYKIVRKRTLRQKRKLIEQVTGKESGDLLDYGSGTGAFLNEMEVAGWRGTGLEPDNGARKVANDLYGLLLRDTDELFDLPGRYDIITLWHVLEHVHELHATMAQLKKLLAEKGRLLIAVPNYTCYDEKAYDGYWAAYDVPRHLYHFSPRSMQVLMEKNGLNIITCKPLWFDSFYISLLSSKYKKGKPQLIPAFFNGLRSNIKAMGNVKKCSSVIYIIGK